MAAHGRSVRTAVGDRQAGPLLLTRTGGRMTRGAAARVVTRLALLAGIEKHLTPHSLRHSAITAALNAGVALRDVQEFARHADPRTTIRYDRAPPLPWTATRPARSCSTAPVAS